MLSLHRLTKTKTIVLENMSYVGLAACFREGAIFRFSDISLKERSASIMSCIVTSCPKTFFLAVLDSADPLSGGLQKREPSAWGC